MQQFEIPDAVDWRKRSIVPAVTDEGEGCDSSWAIVSSSSIASAQMLSYADTVVLSAQQV